MTEFTHISGDRIHMIDVSAKDEIYREATASGKIILRKETIRAITDGTSIKGNVLATARVAATFAVKDTARIIPMCHGIPVHGIDIEFEITDEMITARVRVISTGKTGVEMEALTGVSVALLTIWDMVKSAEKDENGQYPVTTILEMKVEEKLKRVQPPQRRK